MKLVVTTLLITVIFAVTAPGTRACLSRFRDSSEDDPKNAFSGFIRCVLKQQAHGRSPDICHARHGIVLVRPEEVIEHTMRNGWQRDQPERDRVLFTDEEEKSHDERIHKPLFIAFQT